MNHPKVLFVDDDPDMRSLYRLAFDDRVEFVDASSGLKAIEHLSTQKFEAIITDIVMPKMSGVQLIKYIRSSEINAHAKIVVLSGMLTDGEYRAKLASLGKIEIFEKPIDPREVVNAVLSEITIKSARPVAYNPEMIAIVKEAVAKTMIAYPPVCLSVDRTFIKDKPEIHTRSVSCGIYLFGRRVFGSLAITIDKYIIEAILKKMFGDEFTPDSHELIGEIANQLAANLKSCLYEKGVIVNIGLPEIVAEEKQFSPKVSGKTITIAYSWENRPVSVDLCLGNCLTDLDREENRHFLPFVIEKKAS